MFPMVVGPRYIPGQPTGVSGGGWSPDTNKVPDASKITPPVAKPGTRAGHDISLSVKLDAGVAIQDLRSELHKVSIDRTGTSSARVTLASEAVIPNRDFILLIRRRRRADFRRGAHLSARRSRRSWLWILRAHAATAQERFRSEDVTPKATRLCPRHLRLHDGFPHREGKATRQPRT